MKRKTKKNIINIVGIAIFALFGTGLLYLMLINDPTIERHYPTPDNNTSLIIIEHTKTGQKDYIYGVTDGVGSHTKP